MVYFGLFWIWNMMVKPQLKSEGTKVGTLRWRLCVASVKVPCIKYSDHKPLSQLAYKKGIILVINQLSYKYHYKPTVFFLSYLSTNNRELSFGGLTLHEYSSHSEADCTYSVFLGRFLPTIKHLILKSRSTHAYTWIGQLFEFVGQLGTQQFLTNPLAYGYFTRSKG